MPMGKALEIASRLTHPYSIAAFALVLVVCVFWQASRSRNKTIAARYFVAAVVILILGLAPLLASTLLQFRGVYRIRLTVLDPNGTPTQDADIITLQGEVKKANGAWEVDVAPQTRSQDAGLTISAQRKQDFLVGKTTIKLANDYYPTAAIQLAHLPSVIVRGVVIDDRLRPVANATVAIEGYTEASTTNQMGNFEIPSHVAQGQMVTLVARSDNGNIVAKKSGPAGDSFELVLRKP
jgi:hypothetical protein